MHTLTGSAEYRRKGEREAETQLIAAQEVVKNAEINAVVLMGGVTWAQCVEIRFIDPETTWPLETGDEHHLWEER